MGATSGFPDKVIQAWLQDAADETGRNFRGVIRGRRGPPSPVQPRSFLDRALNTHRRSSFVSPRSPSHHRRGRGAGQARYLQR